MDDLCATEERGLSEGPEGEAAMLKRDKQRFSLHLVYRVRVIQVDPARATE